MKTYFGTRSWPVRRFRRLSFSRKLTALMTGTAVVAVALAVGALLALEQWRDRRERAERMLTLAEVVGADSVAALSFQDAGAAQVRLAVLASVPGIDAADLYTAAGRPLAQFRRTGRDPDPPPPIEPDGAHFGKSGLTVFHTILQDGDRVGVLRIRSELADIEPLLQRFALTGGLVLVLCGLAAFFTSIPLQRSISTPLGALTAAARQVSLAEDYSIRVPKVGADEVAAVAEAFNTMLARVAERESALRAARDELELRVRELQREVRNRQQAEHEQRRLQHALGDALREWQDTFDAIELPVLMLDAQGQVRRLNHAAAELAGKRYDECVGRIAQELGADEPWRECSRLARAALRNRKPASSRVRDEATGRTWDVTVSLVKSDDAGGHTILVARDATELVELEASVRQGERVAALGSLVGGVAHEVRNPLFGLSGTLDAFEARFGDRDEYRRYLQVLREQVGRVSELMTELMEYGRPSALEPEAADVDDVLEEAVAACEAAAREAGTPIERGGESGLRAPMDRRRVVLVLRNLIQNAMQHAPGGRVRLEARGLVLKAGRWVELSVRDSGPGFPPEHVSRVFEPFFTMRPGGTGLGLAIAQRVVLEHRGTITASNHPEGGAVVTVRIPAA